MGYLTSVRRNVHPGTIVRPLPNTPFERLFIKCRLPPNPEVLPSTRLDVEWYLAIELVCDTLVTSRSARVKDEAGRMPLPLLMTIILSLVASSVHSGLSDIVLMVNLLLKESFGGKEPSKGINPDESIIVPLFYRLQSTPVLIVAGQMRFLSQPCSQTPTQPIPLTSYLISLRSFHTSLDLTVSSFHTPLPVLEQACIPIQKAYLVLCTNSRVSDLAAASTVLRGK